MDLVSSRIAQLAPSLTLSITAKAKQMKEDGEEVFSFGAGEPDFDTPDHIKQAAADALARGETKYTAAAGLPSLREAISEKFKADNDLEYTPAQISVNCGAKHSCYNAILACCDEGDEVIIPAPYWTSYTEMVKMVGAVPVIVETTEENGWKMTPEQFENAMTGLTKMVIINSPSNPTGAVYTRDELAALGEVAISEDIVILSDEIYEKVVYDGAEHVSIASISKELYDLTITINGFSKAYSMTGWRLGYTAAPYDIAKAINNIQSHSTSNPTTFAQYGGIAALEGDQQIVTDMVSEFDVRRQYALARFSTLNNISVVEPKGAFYFLVNCESMGLKSVNIAERLLSRYGVAVVPGVAFGSDTTLRFSYATSLEIIKNGLDRFEDFARSH